MCGIAGLFPKNPGFESRLGALLGDMLEELGERGPDSAGIAIYRNPVEAGQCKLTLTSSDRHRDWEPVVEALDRTFGGARILDHRGSHVVASARGDADAARAWLGEHFPDVRVVSAGAVIEIYKEKGWPADVVSGFSLSALSGTHGIGHTRMATESAVTTEHSHPFSTGLDLCLVHNGSLSNHNRLRRYLSRHGVEFQTDNDSEVAAGYLMWRLHQGASLAEALEAALRDLDGFYTFAVGTRDGFAVLRDPIACKPAVLAETGDWVAMASEFRAIARLPGAEEARIWEPEPARVYSWERTH